MFKWASSHEMMPPDVYHQLRTVSALRRGRSEARETEGVEPVPIEIVEATKPFLNRQVRALVELQLLTGARGGELFRLRATDLEMDDKKGIWTLRPRDHKTAHHDHDRVIYFGPKAQAVIRPFMVGRPVNTYLFSPAEADAELREARANKRRTPLHRGNRAGTNRSDEPERKPGDHYTAASYRRTIERACDQAFHLPTHLRRYLWPKSERESREEYLARLTDAQKAEIWGWRKVNRWHPHQLRHAAGTLIRKDFGLEAARIILGHSSALVTDAVYAKRDMDKIMEVMSKVG